LTQLYDPDSDIQEVAVRHLEEACESSGVLEMVVEMHPTLDHLGDIGNGLLLK
jgi:rapamycin-insensitive companion of mTOR